MWVILAAALLVSPADLSEVGRIKDPALREVSGIVKSRVHASTFWIHNDSNNTNDLYAMSVDGRILRKFRMPFVNVDWEDIATDSKGRLYLGDTGNNGLKLPIRCVYRFAEPLPADENRVKSAEACYYGFPPQGRFDCEGLFVMDDVVYLVSKRLDGREAEIYVLVFDPRSTLFRPALPRKFMTVPGFTEPATGADLTADNQYLAICADKVTRVYDATTVGRLTLVGEVRYKERNIEAIAWDGLDLVLTDEPGTLFRIKKSEWLRKPGPQQRTEGRRQR